MTSRVTYPGDGTLYAIPFPYLDLTHVKVKVDNVELDTDEYSFPTSGTVQLAADPGAADVMVYRDTPEEPLTVYQSGSVLSRGDLETDSLQALYRIEEMRDSIPVFPISEPLAPLVWDADGIDLVNGDTTLTGDMLLRGELISGEAMKGAALVMSIGQHASELARSLQAAARDIPSVKRWGVEGDGVADDTAPIQAAFDESEEVFFPPGIYSVSAVTFAGRRIMSAGATIVRRGNGATSMFVVSSADAEISALTFDGNSDDNTQAGPQIVVQGARSRLVGCEYTNFYGRVVELDGEGAKVVGGGFRDTGVAANCNCVDMKRAGCAVTLVDFSDIGNGHCIRVGYYGSDTPRSVDGFLIAMNRVKTTLHDAFTYELGANRGLTIANTIDGAEAAFKTELDASIYDLEFALNRVMNLTDTSTINVKATGTYYHHNYHYNLAFGPVLGDGSRCEFNVFRETGGVGVFTAGNRVDFLYNLFIDPALALADQLITVTGGCKVIGNRARSTTSLGIGVRVSGANNQVLTNTMDGLSQGYALISTCSASIFRDNEALNCPDQVAQLGGDGTNLFKDNIGFAGTLPTKTIAAGAITVHELNRTVIVDTEGAAAADDLDTINGGVVDQLLILRPAASGRVPTFKDGIGNLRLAGDCVLAGSSSRLMLQASGTGQWTEVSRSIN